MASKIIAAIEEQRLKKAAEVAAGLLLATATPVSVDSADVPDGFEAAPVWDED